MSDATDLKTLEGLRAAATAPDLARDPANVGVWTKRLAEVLEWFATATLEVRQTIEFQRKLWEDNHVAGVGLGFISVEAALEDEGFRNWFAAKSFEVCPDDPLAARRFLTEWYHALRDRLRPFVRATPHLKVFRVLAVMYPNAMTTVASPSALSELASVLGGDSSLGRAERHAWVRGRLDAVLDPTDSDWETVARRLILPWLLYEKYVASRNEREKLDPLPADRRMKGLSNTRGQLAGMLSTLEFIGDGVTRQELLDFLAKASPDAKTSSLGVVINKTRYG